MRRTIFVTAAAVLLAPALALAQAPAATAPAKPAPAAQAQPPAAPTQAAKPAGAMHSTKAASHGIVRHNTTQAMAQPATSAGQIGSALADVRRGRDAAADVALGNAEVALLNDREAAKLAASESARAKALNDVIDQVTAARAALAHKDRAGAEKAIQSAQSGLNAAPLRT